MSETKHDKKPEELSAAELKEMIAETRASIAPLRASQAETARESCAGIDSSLFQR